MGSSTTGEAAFVGSKPGADKVRWIDGGSRAIPSDARFDIAIMSPKVAQEILDDGDLAQSFADIAARLVPGAASLSMRAPRRSWLGSVDQGTCPPHCSPA